MADMVFRIPAAAFNPGGVFAGKDQANTTIPLFLHRGVVSRVTAGGVGMSSEMADYYGTTHRGLSEVLNLMKKGAIEVLVGGAAQTEAEVLTLYRASWQDQ